MYNTYNFSRSNESLNPIEVQLSGNFKFIMSRKSDGNMGKSNEIDSVRKKFFYQKIGVRPEKVVTLQQEHTHNVFIYRKDHWHCPIGDGIIISDPSLVASITVADCLSIALYDEKSGIFGLVHSGWKGTGIVLEAIKILKSSFCIKPEHLQAVLGPCIQSCCYQTDRERASFYADSWGATTVHRNAGKYYIDLQQANLTILENQGISSVTALTDCTKCGDNFGSYRAEGPNNFTRMVAVAGFIKEGKQRWIK